MFTRNLRKVLEINFNTKNYFYQRFDLRTFSSSLNEFEENIVKSPHPSLSYPKLTIDQFIWKNFEFWKNKIAVVSFFKKIFFQGVEHLKIYL